MNLMFTNLFVFLSHRHPVNQPWPSSSSVSWLTTSGSWWRACTCRHCSLSHLSSRRNTSGGTYLLAGVGTSRHHPCLSYVPVSFHLISCFSSCSTLVLFLMIRSLCLCLPGLPTVIITAWILTRNFYDNRG